MIFKILLYGFGGKGGGGLSPLGGGGTSLGIKFKNKLAFMGKSGIKWLINNTQI